MSAVPWILAAIGAGYVYKKKPEWLPSAIRPKSASRKIAALGAVSATSRPTPAPTAGLDPNMTSAEVAAANGLLAGSADAGAMYAMASDYSGRGYVKTAEALIQKADAVSAAKTHGADDEALYAQMMAATGSSTATQAAASSVPGARNPNAYEF